MGGLRKVAAALGTGVCIVAITAPASAQEQRRFDIAAGSLKSALATYARQSGRQLIYKIDDVKDLRTRGVRGVMSSDEALKTLLAGTGFGQRRDVSGAIAIIRLDARVTPEGNGEGVDIASRGVAEILVIGQRTQNIDIRRSEDDAQPYVVFNREDIEASQATNVEEFLRSRLPQNAGFGGAQAQATGNGKPFSSFNLRGLGANQTLILVNGRRMANLANQNFAPGQADINGIPIGSIERIEVLPASAGGIYGGNAVGGVINIILRSNYRGIEIGATYSDTMDFHAPNGRLDVNGGLSLEGGRTTLTFSGALTRSGTLRVRDRIDLVQKGMDLGGVDKFAVHGPLPIEAGKMRGAW